MQIIPAAEADFEAVKHITQTTIRAVYPQYYPAGAVQFFLQHHCDAHIRQDIAEKRVFLCIDAAGTPAGTVTVKENEILRLFVLPEFQGKGFGGALLKFAEEKAAQAHDEIVLDASFSAKAIYLKKGYREIAYHKIETENGDFLCYDVMKKQVR